MQIALAERLTYLLGQCEVAAYRAGHRNSLFILAKIVYLLENRFDGNMPV